MKMNELMKEGTAGDILNKAIDLGTEYGPKALDYVKRLDPTQKLRKSPTVYSDKAADAAAEIARKNAVNAKLADPAKARVASATDELAAIAAKGDTHAVRVPGKDLPVPKGERVKSLTAQNAADNAIIKANPKIADIPKDDYSALRYAIPAGIVDKGIGAATATDNNPDGYRPSAVAGKLLNYGAGGAVSGVGNTVAGAATGFDEKPEPAAQEQDPTKPQLDENTNDILKLAGVRPITTRDNTSGLVKVKAITTLTESQDLAECGGMMSAPSMPHTPATISINATAGSGEEVANMLASIMKLAGVKEVTPNMLGGDQMPMPVLKTLDIISRADDDSMNGMDDMPSIEVDGGDEMTHHDHNHDHKDFKGELEEQGDEYANAPADPTKVPAFDSNKMADMRNYIDMAEIPAGAPGDNRLPKEEEQIRETKTIDLFQAYQSYKNGQ